MCEGGYWVIGAWSGLKFFFDEICDKFYDTSVSGAHAEGGSAVFIDHLSNKL